MQRPCVKTKTNKQIKTFLFTHRVKSVHALKLKRNSTSQRDKNLREVKNSNWKFRQRDIGITVIPFYVTPTTNTFLLF